MINSSLSNTMILIGNLDLGHLMDTLKITWLLPLLKVLDNLLLDHVGLPHVLVLAVHLVNLPEGSMHIHDLSCIYISLHAVT